MNSISATTLLKSLALSILLISSCFSAQIAIAEEPAQDTAQNQANQPAALADQIQDLKQKVVELNRELFILEEDLLFPASTQVAIFVSMDVGHYFKLDAIKLKIDGDVVASHLYTDRDIASLKKGGIQRLLTTNVKSGEHQATAVLHGIGPENREYKIAGTIAFEKEDEAVLLEVKISDSTAKNQPQIELVQWES